MITQIQCHNSEGILEPLKHEQHMVPMSPYIPIILYKDNKNKYCPWWGITVIYLLNSHIGVHLTNQQLQGSLCSLIVPSLNLRSDPQFEGSRPYVPVRPLHLPARYTKLHQPRGLACFDSTAFIVIFQCNESCNYTLCIIVK